MDRAVRRMMSTSLRFSSADIRKTFIDYFERSHGHVFVPSSPVMPHGDPTLSFVNSGMTQFKMVFLGEVQPPAPRVVNAQKCIRIKGKHNDLSQVGLDGSHHTFFEMLGNWSFGDYFKVDACRMSWELITEVYGIPAERLYVTYFGGDEADSLAPDLETRDIWLNIGVPQNRILPFGMKDNFWEMGVSGPCGPCTEIHYDLVEGRSDAASLVNASSPEVIELWNLVFLQYNRNTDNQLESLSRSFVDTGMGFERLVSVLQGKHSNYETDLFYPMFEVIRTKSGHSGYTGKYDGNEVDIAYRVLADHARMITVTLCDGMLPNLHAKIRAIIRRAFNVSQKVFKVDRGLVKELSYVVAESLSPFYPEIGKKLAKAQSIIDAEEEAFIEKENAVIHSWLELLMKYPEFVSIDIEQKSEFLKGFSFLEESVLHQGKKVIESKEAWKLFDTYGVPVHVTEHVARILGLTFDTHDYEKYAKTMVQMDRVLQDKIFVQKESTRNFRTLLERAEVKPTENLSSLDDRPKNLEVTVVAISDNDQLLQEVNVSALKDGSQVNLVFDKSNFLGPMSGQRSDRGDFKIGEKTVFHVYKTLSIGDWIMHRGAPVKSECDVIRVGDVGVLTLDLEARLETRRSQTAFHILNAVIRDRIPTLEEYSSFAARDKFIFEYINYNEKLSNQVISELEDNVRRVIESGVSVTSKIYDRKELLTLENLHLSLGFTCLAPTARVVEMSGPLINSREVCSGVHAANTSDVGKFVISGVHKTGYRMRQITGLTGKKAETALLNEEITLKKWEELKNFDKRNFDDLETVTAKVEELTMFVKSLSKMLLPYLTQIAIESDMKSEVAELKKYAARHIRRLKPKRIRSENYVVDLSKDVCKSS